MGLLQNAYFAADPDFLNFPGIGGQRPQTISHGGFLRIVTSLTRPVSLPSRIGKENNCTLHALTAAARRNTSLPEGGGLGRSPKTEGASGRIVNSQDRGGTSPGSIRVPVPMRRKDPVKSVWGIDTTSKYQPQKQTVSLSPACSLSHLR